MDKWTPTYRRDGNPIGVLREVFGYRDTFASKNESFSSRLIVIVVSIMSLHSYCLRKREIRKHVMNVEETCLTNAHRRRRRLHTKVHVTARCKLCRISCPSVRPSTPIAPQSSTWGKSLKSLLAKRVSSSSESTSNSLFVDWICVPRWWCLWEPLRQSDGFSRLALFMNKFHYKQMQRSIGPFFGTFTVMLVRLLFIYGVRFIHFVQSPSV